MTQNGHPIGIAQDSDLVKFIPGPVHCIIGVGARRIREAQDNRSPCRVSDAEGHHILVRIAGTQHLHGTAFIFETATQDTVIHIKSLVDAFNA